MGFLSDDEQDIDFGLQALQQLQEVKPLMKKLFTDMASVKENFNSLSNDVEKIQLSLARIEGSLDQMNKGGVSVNMGDVKTSGNMNIVEN